MNKALRNRWNTKVKYDVVQFNLVNPTGSDVVIDMFDSESLTQVNTQATPSDPIANQSQLSVSGTSPVLVGMGYVPSANYLFISDDTGKRIVWDITNNVQISEYTEGAGNGLQRSIIQNPNDLTMWGGDRSAANLSQSNYTTQIQTFYAVTDFVSAAGVLYDAVTNTIFFGYVTNQAIGAFNLNTLTFVDIATPNTLNNSLTIDTVNRRLYSGSSSSAYIAEIDIDSLTLVQEVNFAGTGLVILTELGVDSVSGKLFGGGFDGFNTYIGIFNLSPISFTPIITAAAPALIKPLNLVISQGSLFIYDDNAFGDTVSIIDTASNAIISNQLPVGGDTSSAGGTLVLAPNQALYATKGVGGTIAGDLTVLPIASNFYISGSTDYNFFVKSIFTAPKRIFAIEFNNLNIIQMANQWQIINKDANGEQCLTPYLPNNYTTKFQFDGTEALLDFEDGWILDITSKARYIVPANSEIILLIWYKEIKRSSTLVGTKDFKDDGIAEPAFTAEEYNQQEQTGVEILGSSGRNVFNYWLPKTMLVDTLVDKGEYPVAWKNMEKMIPDGMIIESGGKVTNK